MIKEIRTETEFRLIFEQAKYRTVFVDFYADWCIPCQQFLPLYIEIAQTYPKIAFYKCNIALLGESFLDQYKIAILPLLLCLKGTDVVNRSELALNRELYINFITESLRKWTNGN